MKKKISDHLLSHCATSTLALVFLSWSGISFYTFPAWAQHPHHNHKKKRLGIKHTSNNTGKEKSASQNLPVATATNSEQPASQAAQSTEHVVIRATKPVFVATTSSSATKTSTPLIETPESVSVVTREQMDMQNARSINEALRYSSGVVADLRGGNSRYDQLSIRGFIEGTAGASEYLDGLKLFGGGGFATQQVDSYLLERIDVLKGPPSVVYGQSNPGGIVALTSKWANGKRVREISLEGGNFDYGRGTFDIGDKIPGSSDFSYRLVGTATRQNGYDGYTRSERYTFAPSVNYKPNEDINLTLYGRYQKDPTSASYQVWPTQGTVLPGLFNFSPGFYTGDPNYNKFDRTQSSVGYNFDYQFHPDWVLHSMARYANVGTNYNELGVSGDPFLDPQGSGDILLNRYAYGAKEHFDTITLEERINGIVYTGNVRHDVLVGVSWQNLRDSYNYAFNFAGIPALNLTHPIYGMTVPIAAPSGIFGTSTNQEGIFVQDQASFENWHFQFGFRKDWSKINTRDQSSSQATAVNTNDEAITYRGGILYKFDVGVAPYFNYAQSFQPLQGTDYQHSPFKATRGEQYEVGVKFQPKSFKSFMTVAFYDLTQSNILTTDPLHPNFSIQSAEQRSRGVELEIHASLTDDINLIAAYTNQSVKLTKGEYEGVRPTQIPAQFASFYGTYTQPDGPAKGLGLGVGVRYIGNTNGDLTSQFQTPAYALVDGQIHYNVGNADARFKGMNLQLSAQNLLNKHYITSCYSSSFGCSFGQSRTIIGRVTYNW
ncbi:TonB-dependent siderophore receptor [Entomobacter blattae]|uniref:Ferrichrome outer membrane transporter/phage receptor n=1 Tax=Entomobacter blattae TaxID=2762277 RepID=A0A7H1NPP7_9PROT|nr:TonB-dependent siderophore receptor [Entomobacter blattae]QNT77757.1 Ferrichrome outer membrane transporter/phage receptor [Entomobacter blattae]